jgi:hypothetical protein
MIQLIFRHLQIIFTAVLVFHKSKWLNKTQSKGSIVEGGNEEALNSQQNAKVSAREAAQTASSAQFLLE